MPFIIDSKQETYSFRYHIQTEYSKHYREVLSYRGDRNVLCHIVE